MNKQATNWEKMHPKHLSGKEMVLTLYKLFLQLNNEKISPQIGQKI